MGPERSSERPDGCRHIAWLCKARKNLKVMPLIQIAFFCCASHGHVQTVSTRASGSRKMLAGFLQKLNESVDFDQLVWSNSAEDVKGGLLRWQLNHTIIQSKMARGRAHLPV